MEADKSGKRRTGRAYRRKMERRHRKELRWIILNCGYRPNIGHIDWAWVDGVWEPVGNHIKYPRDSKAQHYWKRHSNKIIRRRKEAGQGSWYRKCFDYRWTLY